MIDKNRMGEIWTCFCAFEFLRDGRGCPGVADVKAMYDIGYGLGKILEEALAPDLADGPPTQDDGDDAKQEAPCQAKPDGHE